MKAIDDFKRFYAEGNNMARKLVIINVLVFLFAALTSVALWALSGGNFDAMFLQFTAFFAVPADASLFVLRPWTIITHNFFHIGLIHLLVNMVFLYWLGNIYREYAGNTKALATYLWGGIIGAVFFVVANNTLPMLANHQGQQLLGASPGVMAIVVALGTFLPYYEVSFFNFYISLRWVALGVVTLLLLNLPHGNVGGQIAHLGGIIFGYFYGRHLRRSSTFGSGIENIGDFISGLFKRKPKLTVVKKETTVYSSSTITDFDDEYEPNQEVIDAILDKISQSGYESLTRKERDLLYKASKQD